MAQALASDADVETRLGRTLTTDEAARVDGLLEEASVMVSGWVRVVPDPVPDAVTIVVSRMVARVFTAGGGAETGVESIQATMGPFQVNRGFSTDATSGGVWLTRQDKAMLRPVGSRGRVENAGSSKW